MKTLVTSSMEISKIRRFSRRVEDLVKLHGSNLCWQSFMVNFEYASYIWQADWIGLYEIVEDIKPASYSSIREA